MNGNSSFEKIPESGFDLRKTVVGAGPGALSGHGLVVIDKNTVPFFFHADFTGVILKAMPAVDAADNQRNNRILPDNSAVDSAGIKDSKRAGGRIYPKSIPVVFQDHKLYRKSASPGHGLLPEANQITAFYLFGESELLPDGKHIGAVISCSIKVCSRSNGQEKYQETCNFFHWRIKSKRHRLSKQKTSSNCQNKPSSNKWSLPA
jgi:hypothetical protein